MATAWLAWELTRRRSTVVAGALVRIAAGPPGPAAQRALCALAEMGEDPEVFGEIAYQALLHCDGEIPDNRSRAVWRERMWPSVAAPLLLAPAPAGRHVPHVRLVSLLDHEPTASTGRKAEHIVGQLMMCVAPRRRDLRGFLSTTDHPLLLEALAEQWRGRFLPSATETEIVVANPHIVPRDSGDTLLAVAKDRPDLIDDDRADTADTLVDGTRLTAAGLADKYRRALRRLGPGAARERVCELALIRLQGQEEARAAALDAGYLPAGERDRVVFLYLTRQWELYDTADPDGQKIYDAWVASHTSYVWSDTLADEISETARDAGRADPRDRWLAAHPERRIAPDAPLPRRRGPIGGISGAWGDSGGSVHT
ncbi:hypothetical protein [Nonomuraea sp. B19D2]|uniref:hypothetical protein n=1 Tax=Nonomuraea sp. B19D2 TaxID=3159561 RepID=UPI0032DA3991